MATPRFLDITPAQTLTDVIATTEQLCGYPISEGMPEYSICTAIAYREILLNDRINETAKANLVDFSVGSMLDYLASPYAIVRLSAQKAATTLRFTLVVGHGTVVLPIGTRVISDDGSSVFETSDDVTVPLGTNEATVIAVCQTSGIAGNGHAAGKIKTLMDPLAYVSAVENISTSIGGSEKETDLQLRERIKLATAKFSVAGSRNAYKYWAKTASPLIIDVAVTSLNDFAPFAPFEYYDVATPYYPGETVVRYGVHGICIKESLGDAQFEDTTRWIKQGEVHILCLLQDGSVPDDTLNALILQTISQDTIRPLTDTVIVHSPGIKEYTIDVEVVKTPDALGSTVVGDLLNIVYDFGQEKVKAIGLDVVCSEIEARCRISGVYDATVTITPRTLNSRNLIVQPWEIAKLTDYNVTIVGSNNG